MPAPFVPSSDDSSVQMLRSVFGPVIDHLAGTATAVAQTPQAAMLTAAFEYFNSGILFFGSVLLTWITVTGTAHTANDGQALGKNWSTMWTPVRTITATGALMPIASGYSVIQALVLTIVLWSVGLAGGMWNKVVDVGVNQNLAEQASVNVMNEASFQDATTAALQMQVCAAAVNQSVNAAIASPNGGSGPAINLQLGTKETDIGSTHATTFYYEDPNWPRSEGLCGALTLKVDKPVPEQNGLSTTKYWFHADASATSRQVKQELASQVQSVTSDYYRRLFAPDGAVGALAQKIVNTTANPTVNPMELVSAIGIGSSMWDSINSAAASAARANNQNITAALTSGGWIYAGSWQTEVGRVQDTLRSTLANAKVEVIPSANSLASSLSGDLLAATQPVVDQARTTSAELVKQAIQIIREQEGVADAAGKKTKLTCRSPSSPISSNTIDPSDVASDGGASLKRGISDYFNASIGERIVTCIISNVAAEGVDPVMQLKGLGDSLLTLGDFIMMTIFTVQSTLDGLAAFTDEVASGVDAKIVGIFSGGVANGAIVGLVKGLISFLKAIVSASSGTITTIMYCGYFLSIWLPMVPFIIFALGVVGWLVTVVEAVAASALWMVMHISPEGGDSFVGGQKQGYLLILSLFFRPALMILGIVASMAIMYPAMGFINSAFEIKMRALQVQSVTGLASIAGFLIVYCFLCVSVMTLLFALPQTLPDRILKWIGGNISDLGEQHSMQRTEMGASRQAQAAVAGAMGSMMKGGGRSGGAGGARISQPAANDSDPTSSRRSQRAAGALDSNQSE